MTYRPYIHPPSFREEWIESASNKELREAIRWGHEASEKALEDARRFEVELEHRQQRKREKACPVCP